MPRTIPITDLAKGIQNDNPVPGTMRECTNLLPWRGSLRRRGPIVGSDDFTSTAALALLPAESAYNPKTRIAAAALHGVKVDSTGTKSAIMVEGTATPLSELLQPYSRLVPFGDEVFVCMQASSSTNRKILRWCGGTVVSATGTGTVTLTDGSRHATFSSSTGCTEAVNAGYILADIVHGVKKQISSTTVLLDTPAIANYVAGSFTYYSITGIECSPSASGGGMFSSTNGSTPGYVNGAAACAHQGRLFVGNIIDNEYSGTSSVDVIHPDRIRWSGLEGEEHSSGYVGYQNFSDDAYTDLQSSGGEILGLVSFNGALVAIRRSQVDVLTGAFATDGSDIGAQVNTVATNVGAGGFHAWEQFEGGIAFADEKGVYVWDGSRVSNLTRGSIERAYRKAVSTNPSRIIVSCPGNRIMVWVDAAPTGVDAFVFDLNVGGWFRVELDAPYGRAVDTGSSYLAMRNERFSVGGGNYEVRSYDLRGVFEDLDTDTADRALDEDASSYVFGTYLLTNPIPLMDGWLQGRVSEVVLVDGGLTDDDSLTDYMVKLLRGSIYSGDVYSGESDLSSMNLCAAQDVPQITGSTVDQRAVKVRIDGSEDATHAMVEVTMGGNNGSATFAYGINAIGLVVEDNPNFPSA